MSSKNFVWNGGWVELAQDRAQCWSLVLAVLNL